jgi:drug/metabolite transporter (DMT)-like permease
MRLLDVALLLVAICSASTGVIWFALLSGSPILRACWRMQTTFVIQLPLMLYELRRMDAEKFARWKRDTLTWTLPTGIILGAHFAACAASVAMTSLSHAILVINVSPLFLVAAATVQHLLSVIAHKSGVLAARGVALDAERKGLGLLSSLRTMLSPDVALPPTQMEAAGAVLAFMGMAGLVMSASSAGDEARATVAGDLIGVTASMSMAAYLLVGKRMRKWCPLFSWMCPLHFSAAITLAVTALLVVPGTVVASPDPISVFSWVYGGKTMLYAFAAGATAGCLGHGIANYVMSCLSTLVVSVAMLLQPPVSAMLGFLIGLQGPPGPAVLVCAPIILYGAFLVTMGGRDKGLHWRDVLACRLAVKPTAESAAFTAEDSATSVAVESGSSGEDAREENEWKPASAAQVPRLLPTVV